MVSLKSLRLKDALTKPRCVVTCMRCVAKLKDGDFETVCRFPTQTTLLKEFVIDNKQFNRCEGCLRSGQDCFHPGREFKTELKKLYEDVKKHDEEDMVEEKAVLASKIKEDAAMLYAVFQTRTPYATHFEAHHGTNEWDGSEVMLSARDRSAEGNLAREAAKKRRIEDIAEGYEPVTPTKKAKFGAHVSPPTNTRGTGRARGGRGRGKAGRRT